MQWLHQRDLDIEIATFRLCGNLRISALPEIFKPLRIWPVFVLGRRFSALVAIQPGHEPVTNGSYGFIRHPRHRGMIILMLG